VNSRTQLEKLTHVLINQTIVIALKKHAISLQTLAQGYRAAAFVLKIYHTFKETMVEINIWWPFGAILYIHDIEKMPDGLLFNEKKFQQSRGFVELSERNTALECLSKRRRELKIGWINKLK
jgi:hypothetical protein